MGLVGIDLLIYGLDWNGFQYSIYYIAISYIIPFALILWAFFIFISCSFDVHLMFIYVILCSFAGLLR